MRSAALLDVARGGAHSARSGAAAPASSAGLVYLIGAGPGAPDLITIRGLRCLQGADVVVHDRLVDPDLVAASKPGADIVYAGKGRGRPGLSQPAINDLLIAKARAGLTVARLKGGDPFVFGRGFEEARALGEAGIRFEVVPGVSSATAVPGAAGIPLTHRGVSSGFAVVTAKRASGATDWGALAHVDTLVILMGVARLGEATRELIRHGRDGATPVAVIERGTMGGEKIVVSVLREAARDAATAALRPPAIVIVGEVVRLRGPASFQAAGSIADGRAEPVFHDTTWR